MEIKASRGIVQITYSFWLTAGKYVFTIHALQKKEEENDPLEIQKEQIEGIISGLELNWEYYETDSIK